MIDGQTHTHAGNDNTRRPKLASGKNHCIEQYFFCKSQWHDPNTALGNLETDQSTSLSIYSAEFDAHMSQRKYRMRTWKRPIFLGRQMNNNTRYKWYQETTNNCQLRNTNYSTAANLTAFPTFNQVFVHFVCNGERRSCLIRVIVYRPLGRGPLPEPKLAY